MVLGQRLGTIGVDAGETSGPRTGRRKDRRLVIRQQQTRVPAGGSESAKQETLVQQRLDAG